MNSGDRSAGFLKDDRFQVRPEIMHALGQLDRIGPTIERVVIAMHDEGPNSGLTEPTESITESQLRFQTAIGTVVDISGDQQEIDLLPQAKIDDHLKRSEGRFAEFLDDPALSHGQPPQPDKRAVEMKVCRMNERESGHRDVPQRA